jgi:hypothetical protein
MATFALLSWPVISLVFFAQRAIVPAILAATVIPYLFLPEAFSIEFSGMPDINKTTSISIGLMLGLAFFGNRARAVADLPCLKTRNVTFVVVLFALLLGTFGGVALTIMTNGELLVFGQTVLPGMRAWDSIGRFVELAVFFAPYFLGRKYLASVGSQRALLRALVFSALGYSLLMLFEIRFSPQLHNLVYGYFQHSFFQHIRDGYRPMVFLEHGLWVGFFIFMALIAAAGLWKAERNTKWLWAGGWVFIILMISKNLGAFAIGLMCLGVYFFLWRKMQILFVVAVAVATLTYPVLRQAQLVPIDQVLAAAASISEDRAGSLRFRLVNEDVLLERALLKPLAGWGSWSRDRIFDEDGIETSISEGLWILTLGAWGWIGYIGLFGLLALPLITLVVTARRKEIPPETIALALICAGNLIYLIPNATLTPIGLLCFGALAGFAQYDLIKPQKWRREALNYTRFPNERTRRHDNLNIRS